jgi:hypothetical protein
LIPHEYLDALSYYLDIKVKQGSHERLKLSRHSTAEVVDVTLYGASSVGLHYLTHTRPDIAFAIEYVKRFMKIRGEDHWMAVKRLLRYIKDTTDQGIVFPKSGDKEAPRLVFFGDADITSDIDGRRSTSDMLVFLDPAPISWQSLKQKIVALSTCEVEYVSVAMGACQAFWLHRQLEITEEEEATPPTLMVDNQPAIALPNNLVLHDRSKHIDFKFHFLRSCVDEGKIIIEFVEIARQLADILTKSADQAGRRK